MPSGSEAQARLMAGIAHGWHPSGLKHAPSQAVAQEFNQADQGTALLSRAMQHHAAGGEISPLSSIAGNPMHMRSTLPKFGNPMGSAGHMRMPHIPIMGSLHNIDQHMGGTRARLAQLKAGGRYDTGGDVPRGSSSPGSPGISGAVGDALAALRRYLLSNTSRDIANTRQKYEDAQINGTYAGPQRQAPGGYADGGEVAALGERAMTAIKNALSHLSNKDASSAAATLRASPEAMQHPTVAQAAQALRASSGIAPASKALTGLVNQNTDQTMLVRARGGRTG